MLIGINMGQIARQVFAAFHRKGIGAKHLTAQTLHGSGRITLFECSDPMPFLAMRAGTVLQNEIIGDIDRNKAE